MEVVRTERGWAGHFIGAKSCMFRRNTLLEFQEVRIVVSTVGSYHSLIGEEQPSQIAINRYYETMCFVAEWSDPYWEANVEREIFVESDSGLGKCNWEADREADLMHENIIEEIRERLMNGEKFLCQK